MGLNLTRAYYICSELEHQTTMPEVHKNLGLSSGQPVPLGLCKSEEVHPVSSDQVPE